MSIPVARLDARVQAHVTRAWKALEQGEASYTQDICVSILEKHPDCLEVRQLLRAAQRQIQMGRSGSVHGGLQRGLVVFWMLRAVGLRSRRPAAALACLERVLTANPDHVGAHRMSGFIALDLGWVDTAVSGFEEWAQLSPNDPAAFVALGMALLQAGREEEAIKAAEAAVHLDPNGTEAHALLKEASVAHTLRSSGMQEPSGP